MTLRRLAPSRALRALTLAAFALGACGDDATTPGDTADTGDTSPGDTTPGDTTPGDTTPGDTTPGDTTPGDTTPGDTTPGDTTPGDVSGAPLDGTNLAGIVLSWPAPFELCNAWQEGASIEAEVAHKVRIVVPAQARTDLAFASLAAAPLEGARVVTGPFADEQWSDVARVGVRVTRFDVIEETGYDQLIAEVRHDLGAAGVLIETYGVTRADGEDADVIVTPATPEVTFAWAPEGEAVAHRLELCGVPEGYEHAVEVLAGDGPGDSAVTLVRFYETLHRDFGAGSYDVRMVATQVVLSDMPWWTFEATGPWSQTYAAQHHNWGDATRLDFTRDLAAWQTVFAPLEDGEPILEGVPSRVQLADVGPDAGGTIVVTRLSAEGAPSDTTYTAGTWRRVDVNALGRELAGTCADGVVGAVGYGDHVAQLMLCPDASAPRGKRLVGVVPVVWASSPEVAGERFGEDAIAPLSGRLGWIVPIGGSELIVEPQDNDAFLTEVLDDGESVAEAWSELMQLAPQHQWSADVDAGKGELSIHIARRWAAQGVGESSIYAVDHVRVIAADAVWTVEAWDRIDYVNTHHNWNDTLEATTDDGHVLHWTIVYDFEHELGLVQTVWVTGPDGEEVVAPTVVTPIDSGGGGGE